MAEAGPPPRLDLRTTRQMLLRSSETFAAALPPFLLAALLLLFFRCALLAGTLHLSSVVDRDPAVRSLFSRLSAADPHDLTPSPRRHPPPPSRHRPPFLHLTRVGTLDDDFFSDSDVSSDRRPSRRSPFNSTYPIPLFLLDGALGFSRPAPKPLKLPVTDFPSSPVLFSFPDDDAPAADEDQIDRAIEVQIFGRGLDLGRQDAIAILYLLSLLSSTQTFAIVGFILCYTCALGIVFLATTASLLGKPVSLFDTVYSGARLGIRRLTGSVFLRWSARDALIQFLCIFFFSDIRDQGRLFKLFVRVKLMPFSLTAPFPLAPWFGPTDPELSVFFYMWAVIDMVTSIALAFNPFVMIMDQDVRRRGGDLVKEGSYLVSLMLSQAVFIKCLETLVCGKVGRSALMLIGGRLFAVAVQSVAEVYFMVVWLTLYFATRCKDAELEGQRFGRGNLEDCINSIR